MGRSAYCFFVEWCTQHLRDASRERRKATKSVDQRHRLHIPNRVLNTYLKRKIRGQLWLYPDTVRHPLTVFPPLSVSLFPLFLFLSLSLPSCFLLCPSFAINFSTCGVAREIKRRIVGRLADFFFLYCCSSHAPPHLRPCTRV